MSKQRIKTGTMMFPEIIQLCDNNIELANVKSRNDFIEEAIKFYVSYLNTEHNTSFLNDTIESVIKSSIQLTENRLAKVLFKLTVETSMLMNIIGASFEIDDVTLDKLRTKCIKDIKSTIGTLNLQEIMKYQNSEVDDG
ncbi:hypothetical protein [Erysipelothrix anatis]|uniref:hypothetical protein n=1 Tax=Erysipelothrix anatis TaxID=2683713 RepID=UPI001358D041|nr:hypothetical protein [Erysipelothrix anatis]